jgi:hypothetical protein
VYAGFLWGERSLRDWIDLAQDWDRLWALVNMVIDLWVP